MVVPSVLSVDFPSFCEVVFDVPLDEEILSDEPLLIVVPVTEEEPLWLLFTSVILSCSL